MGECADGNCPSCQASRARYAAEFEAMAEEERRKGVRTFVDRVEAIITRERNQKRREWIQSKEQK